MFQIQLIPWYFEWVGVVASLFIFTSFIFNSRLRLLIINFIGSAMFVIYGVLIGSPSTFVLNLAIIILQLIKIRKEGKLKKNSLKDP